MLKPTEGAVSKLHGDAELNQNMSDVEKKCNTHRRLCNWCEKKIQQSQKIPQLV